MIDSDVEFLKIRKYLHMTPEQLKDPKVKEAYNIMLDCISRKKKFEITANMYKDGAFEHNKSYANKLYKNQLTKFNDDMDALNTILDPSLVKEQNAREKLQADNLEEAYKDIMEKTQTKEAKKTETLPLTKDTKKDAPKNIKATKSPKKEKQSARGTVEDDSENEEKDDEVYERKMLTKEKQKVASLTSAMHRKQAKEKRNNIKKKFFKNKLEKTQPKAVEAE